MQEAFCEVEQHFETLFKFAPIGVALIDQEGVLVQSNPAFQELLGCTGEDRQNRSLIQLSHLDDGTEFFKLFQELLTRQRTHFLWEAGDLLKNGCSGGQLSIWAVGEAAGCPQYAIAMLQPRGDSQHTPPSLEVQPQPEKQLTAQTTELLQTQALLKQARLEREQAQEALKVQQEFLQTLVNVYPHTIFAKGSFAVVTDATTLEAMESELRQTKEQLRAVLDAVPGFVSWISAQGRYLGVNQYLADTFNLSPDAFVGQELGFLKNSPDFVQFMAQFLASSAQNSRQVIEAHVNGSTRDYLIAAQKCAQNSLAVSIGIDISDRKLAEAQAQASLREKEVLLQEVHHRVKNNLQVISSLLDLQSQQIKEQAVLEIFRESQNRVKSMALVHEKLYQSKNFARINFANYTKSLTNFLLKAYDLNTGNITLELDLDEITLNIDTAIPCGLILNELVSNALKHAFPAKTSGIVRIAIHSGITHPFTLVVADNGLGVPDGFNLKSPQSLGIKLVKVLAKQLKGNVELDCTQGSQFRVNFSEINR